MIKIIAHRGDTAHQPENTLSAFRAALDAGADAIELDVHLSKDGVLIVHHDYYLGNPDNGEGAVHDKESAYIKTLTISESEHIPTLEEVFVAIGNKLNYEIELKGYSEAFLHKTLDLAGRYGLIHHIEFTSPHPYILTKVKRLDPDVKTGAFVPPLPSWMDKKLGQTLAIQNALLGGIDVIHCPIELIDRQFVDNAHGAQLIVHAADCDTDESLDAAVRAGVDQLSTNNLTLALKHGSIYGFIYAGLCLVSNGEFNFLSVLGV